MTKWQLLSDLVESTRAKITAEPIESHEVPPQLHKTGKLQISYNELVKLFGEPLRGNAVSTNCEWFIKLTESSPHETTVHYAVIYDINEDDDTRAEEILEWNVGTKIGYDYLVLHSYIHQNKSGIPE